MLNPRRRIGTLKSLNNRENSLINHHVVQVRLGAEHSGLIIELPEDVTNMLEVPLWLRGSR